jgi:hypothetical protein
MTEGPGSGFIPLTNGSGSGRPKNMWIRFRIRIRNTAPGYAFSSVKGQIYRPLIFVFRCVAADPQAMSFRLWIICFKWLLVPGSEPLPVLAFWFLPFWEVLWESRKFYLHLTSDFPNIAFIFLEDRKFFQKDFPKYKLLYEHVSRRYETPQLAS